MISIKPIRIRFSQFAMHRFRSTIIWAPGGTNDDVVHGLYRVLTPQFCSFLLVVFNSFNKNYLNRLCDFKYK